MLDELAGNAPKDQTIDFAVGMSGKLKKNKFENGKIDGYVTIATIPEGLDTSIPVILTVNYIVTDSSAGNLEAVIETAQIELGHKLDGTHTVNSSEAGIIPIEANGEEILRQFKILLHVNEMVPGEFLALTMKRDASATRIGDTYQGDVGIVSVSAIGHFWKP